MKSLKVKTPAKINLTLEILNKRKDGFHNIQSIMQTVNLYDCLTINVEEYSIYQVTNFNKNEISLSGNSNEIPYNKTNIAFKATKLFLEKANITNTKIQIHIEKNIPVSAGLAGGSSNAAGVLFGLNKLFNYPLSEETILQIASILGSDVNFCYLGGTQLATQRGEMLEKIKTPDLKIIIVKPKNLGISAKEAYTKYAKLKQKPESKITKTMIEIINNNEDISNLLNNELELAILPDYQEIQEIKNTLKKQCKNTLMSGSGPSVFGIYESNIDIEFDKNKYDIFKVQTITNGITTE